MRAECILAGCLADLQTMTTLEKLPLGIDKCNKGNRCNEKRGGLSRHAVKSRIGRSVQDVVAI